MTTTLLTTDTSYTERSLSASPKRPGEKETPREVSLSETGTHDGARVFVEEYQLVWDNELSHFM